MTTLRICGIDINLVFSAPDDWAPGGMGRSSQINSRITIRKGLQDDTEIGVILHEVLHMIADMNELKHIQDDETTISVLAHSLNAFLSDNADTIIKYYTGEKDGE